MSEGLSKDKIIRLIATIVIVAAVGIVVVFMELANVKTLLRGGEISFETLGPDEIESDLLVNISIDTNFGSYMEEYEILPYSDNRTTDLYYVIWTGDDENGAYKYMGIKVPVSEQETMDAITEATYSGEYAGVVSYSGVINKMAPEEYQYFKEYFTDGGWTEEEVMEGTLPYYISVGEAPGGANLAFVITLILIMGVIIFTIWKV